VSPSTASNNFRQVSVRSDVTRADTSGLGSRCHGHAHRRSSRPRRLAGGGPRADRRRRGRLALDSQGVSSETNHPRDFRVRLVPATVAGRLLRSCRGFETNDPYWIVGFRADHTTYHMPPKLDGNGWLYSVIAARSGALAQQGLEPSPVSYRAIGSLSNYDLAIPTATTIGAGTASARRGTQPVQGPRFAPWTPRVG
jgi:hypothetical protein